MKNALKWPALAIASAGLLAAGLRLYAPFRAKKLAARYARFRAAFQPQHDALDSHFNHHETTVAGLRWHYVDEGAPAGRVILFLHGLPEGWYSWRYVLPLVDHNYRLIAVDMKGYGRSDLQDADYDWHHVAAQTLDLMDSLGVRQFYVVGHDWGALIGSVLVADHPDRILGFVRMEADLLPKDLKLAEYLQKPQWLLFRSNWLATYLMRDAGRFIDLVYRSRMATPLRAEDRDYLVYEFSRPGVAEMNPRYFKRSNWDLGAALGRICQNTFPFPVLQLQADGDPAQPPEMFADAPAACPNVRLEWVTAAGHFSNLDQPAQVAAAIDRYVQTLDR
jgi:epoxide hydrolase 4